MSTAPKTGPHIETDTTKKFNCQKCGHRWPPKIEKTIPGMCPKCKSKKYWLPKVPGVGRPPRAKSKGN